MTQTGVAPLDGELGQAVEAGSCEHVLLGRPIRQKAKKADTNGLRERRVFMARTSERGALWARKGRGPKLSPVNPGLSNLLLRHALGNSRTGRRFLQQCGW